MDTRPANVGLVRASACCAAAGLIISCGGEMDSSLDHQSQQLAFTTVGAQNVATLAAATPAAQEISGARPGNTAPAAQGVYRRSYQDPGRFAMIEDTECVTVHDPKDKDPIEILSEWELPSGIDRGTVILNGWDVRYLHGDHHVMVVGAEITHAKVTSSPPGPRYMVWQATGVLADKNRDDDFEFCYRYTAFGWSSSWIDATVAEDYNGVEASDYVIEGTKAQITANHRGALRYEANVAVLPRGFRAAILSDSGWDWWPFPHLVFDQPTDHHVQQLAFSQSQDLSAVDDDEVRWETQMVFKDDNDGGHAYFAKGLSSLVAGPSMEVQAVPYNLTPNNTQGSCIVPGGGVRTRRVTVSGLGYDYVVPMLTGWNLSYPCSDEHVLRAGVWLHDINYDRSSGTLTYNVSSVLRDDDAFPGHLFHRNVALLGFWASDRPFVPDRPLSIKR